VQRGGHQPADKSADREPDEQGEQHCVIHTSQTAVPPRQCRRGAPPVGRCAAPSASPGLSGVKQRSIVPLSPLDAGSRAEIAREGSPRLDVS
jgi:hypothetical protein